MLHWIELSKALGGHPSANATDALAALISAREDGTAVFPIADTTYMEVANIGQHRQRRDLREVIELLSGYSVVMSRADIATHEIEALLDREIGPSSRPINTMSYLDWGVARAFGKVGGFRVHSTSGEDVTEQARMLHPNGPEAFDVLLAAAELQLNRAVLDGPANADEEAELRANGWQPRGGFEVARNRALQEVEQVERLNDDPRWRAGRIRDVVAARELIIELMDMLTRGLIERDTTIDSMFGSRDETRRVVDCMPSCDVSITLKTELHRDPKHKWTTNDIHDIDALASTIPYCDFVVTDKAMAAAATRTGLSQRLGSTVFASLNALAEQF